VSRLGGKQVLICDNPGKPPTLFVRLSRPLVLEIYPAADYQGEAGENSLPGWRHLALQVPSLDAARDLLCALDINFTEPVKPAGGGGRVLFFRDPEGNLLHLVERPPASIFRFGPD
jgi:catechol 2,3-dioxygenase-like lactoylglutathione lyase family enzyme